jgi:hypothetical protein
MPKLSPQKSRPMKLTDTQLIVLSRAAQRDDGAAAVPEGMTQRAALRLAASLIDKKLVREVKATAGKPVWRQSEEEGPYALIITKLGRAALSVADEGEAKGVDVAEAKGAEDDAGIPAQEKQAPSAGSGPNAPRPGSKLADVIALLDRDAGASIAELISATGWLPHTTRAALTGLRKRGYAITRQHTEEGGSVYRIVASLVA